MSFINKCEAAWDQPLGQAIEDFKDLSKTQKAAVLFCTTAVAIALPIISIPLAVITFRSLVGRCTEENDDQNEQPMIQMIEASKMLESNFKNALAKAKEKGSTIAVKKDALIAFTRLINFNANAPELSAYKKEVDKLSDQIINTRKRKLREIRSDFTKAWLADVDPEDIVKKFLKLDSFLQKHPSLKNQPSINYSLYKEVAIDAYKQLSGKPGYQIHLADLHNQYGI